MSVAGGAAAACMARRRYESTPQLSPSYLFPRAGRGAGTACLPNDAARGISKSLAAAPVTQASPAIAELPNWWLGVRVSGTRVVPTGEEDLMANRWTPLPPAMIALPFLVTACLNGPTGGGGAPRFNLFYDTDGDGLAEGVAFYGGAAHVSGTPAEGWTSMSASAATPDFRYSFPAGDCSLTSSSTVVELSVFVDELGAWNIDVVRAAGATTGEPNGT